MRSPLSVAVLAAVLGNRVTPPAGADELLVFYDPWPMTQLDRRSMIRGGRWRALARWRNWWRREHRPADRRTSRRTL